MRSAAYQLCRSCGKKRWQVFAPGPTSPTRLRTKCPALRERRPAVADCPQAPFEEYPRFGRDMTIHIGLIGGGNISQTHPPPSPPLPTLHIPPSFASNPQKICQL